MPKNSESDIPAGSIDDSCWLRPLTDRQSDVFLWIYEFTRDRGYQPSFRDVSREFRFRSTNSVRYHLDVLAHKGWIEPVDFGNRCIRFLFRPDGSPFCGFSDL